MAQELGPLVVIVGETGSGKSALAMEIAEKFNGEIIAADSRTVYKGMNIGTAKPTEEDQAKIVHHLLDVSTPDKPLNVADFKRLANEAIEAITTRGKLPILVGGTGLYIDAVIFDYQFRPGKDAALREELSQLSVDELQAQLGHRGIALPKNQRNPRHLIRAIETNGESPQRLPLRKKTLLIGLQVDREVLMQRITQRIDAMIAHGFIDEVRQLSQQYGGDIEALQAPGYKAFRGYLEGEVSLAQAREEFIRNDLRLAKRQRTWFKRNESIHWVREQGAAVVLITTFLNK